MRVVTQASFSHEEGAAELRCRLLFGLAGLVRVGELVVVEDPGSGPPGGDQDVAARARLLLLPSGSSGAPSKFKASLEVILDDRCVPGTFKKADPPLLKVDWLGAQPPGPDLADGLIKFLGGPGLIDLLERSVRRALADDEEEMP